MAVNEADVVAGALEKRAHAQSAQKPRVDRHDDRGKQTEPRGTRGKGALHRAAILIGACGVVLGLVAWAAFLVYVVVLVALVLV